MVGRRLISGARRSASSSTCETRSTRSSLRLSFGFYDRHQTGQLMSRATVDLQTVRFFLGYGLIFFFQNVLTIVGATAVMFVVNWKLALVAIGDRAVLIVVSRTATSTSRTRCCATCSRRWPTSRRSPRRTSSASTSSSRSRRSSAEQAKFERRSEAVFAQSVDANRQRALYVPLLSFLPLLAQAARAARRRPDGRARHARRPARSSSSTSSSLMLVMPLRMLGMWIGQAQRATASGERIFEIMDEPEEIADRPGASSCRRAPGRVRYEQRLVRVRAGPAGARRTSTSSSSRARPSR